MERSVVHQQSTLQYDVLGTGAHAVILFHGFGQDRTIFRALPNGVLKIYTVYSIDLFFHGGSSWGNGEAPIDKNAWKEIMSAFLERENITRFEVGGFSLGSRLAIATFTAFPDRVVRMILIAPDAVVNNFWYKLATGTALLRMIFKSMILHPKRFNRLLTLLQRTGVIGKSLAKFASRQMDTHDKRTQVFYTWVVLRKLQTRRSALVTLLEQHNVPVRIILGNLDTVIKISAIDNFLKRLKYPQVLVLETGHMGLVGSGLKYILSDDSFPQS